MQKIATENINLFTSTEDVYIAPIVDGLVSVGYLVAWREIDDFVSRLKLLQESKQSFDNGEFTF